MRQFLTRVREAFVRGAREAWRDYAPGVLIVAAAAVITLASGAFVAGTVVVVLMGAAAVGLGWDP